MISLDQVQLLEKKVAAIVAKMNELQKQNSYLLAQNKEFASRNEDLYAQNQVLLKKVSTFEADQGRIEQGILNALEKLNAMENDGVNSSTVMHSTNTTVGTGAIESEPAVENHSPITPSVSMAEDSAAEKTAAEEPEIEEQAATSEETEMKTEVNLDDDVFNFLNFDENSQNDSSEKGSLDIF
ncbi:MAG: hypothetical protein K6G52_07485 [Treponemataceae bacterium]|nr:hypothetical protein [Treponemataceae bacterium]